MKYLYQVLLEDLKPNILKVKTVGCEKHSESGCNGKYSKCITHDLWDELEDYINNFFQQKTLSDLINKRTLNG